MDFSDNDYTRDNRPPEPWAAQPLIGTSSIAGRHGISSVIDALHLLYLVQIGPGQFVTKLCLAAGREVSGDLAFENGIVLPDLFQPPIEHG